MTDWATPADVLTYTGVTVTDDEVIRAQFIVELFAGTTTDASDRGLITSRNLRLLRQAVAFQSAWMTEHPDVFTSVDVTTFSQDGVSATQAHANAHLLAPLAKRCIDRLSWKRNRGLQIRRRLDAGQIPRTMNVINAAADDNDPRWRRIGSDGAPC